MRVHHIGYIVTDLPKSIAVFESIGYRVESKTVYDAIRDVDIVFMNAEDSRIELVSPKSDNSVVANTLKKVGNSVYHICYYCENLGKAIQEFRKKGFVQIGEAAPAVAIEGKPVVFFYNRQIGIIELVEE